MQICFVYCNNVSNMAPAVHIVIPILININIRIAAALLPAKLKL